MTAVQGWLANSFPWYYANIASSILLGYPHHNLVVEKSLNNRVVILKFPFPDEEKLIEGKW